VKLSIIHAILGGLLYLAPGDETSLPGGMVFGLTSTAAAQVFEDQLGSGSTSAVKSLRRGVRKTIRTVLGSSRRWRDWLPGIVIVSAMLLLVPAMDRTILATWRDRGFSAARMAFILGVTVYLRLIFDRRAPTLGKLLLLFAVVYGVARRDLMPDAYFPVGLIDDAIVIILTSRAFLRMCPDRLIEEHAVKAARRRAWSLRHRSAA
jgi:uncharacterized membrane protein YkvA (DUF1232 family)